LVPGTTIEIKIKKNTGSNWYQIRGLPVVNYFKSLNQSFQVKTS